MKKLNFFKSAPQPMQALLKLEQSLKGVIDPLTMELIKIRSSQINGCAYCLNMHVVDALKIGETVQRIVLLDAWWETDLFTPKEKVVLELIERVTLISSHHFDDDFHAKVAKFFITKEFGNLCVEVIIKMVTTNEGDPFDEFKHYFFFWAEKISFPPGVK